MIKVLRSLPRVEAFFCAFLLAGCETISSTGVSNGLQVSPEASERVKSEQIGDYFIGRRLVGQHFYFWGYVKKPGENWDRAKLVMLNEKITLAPDRGIACMDTFPAIVFTNRPAADSFRSSS